MNIDAEIELRPQAAVMNRLLLALLWGPPLLYLLINIGVQGLPEFWDTFTGAPLWWIGSLLCIFLIHEVLHGIGLWFAGADRRKIYFRFDKKTLSFECRCTAAVSLRGLKVAILLPFLILTPALLWIAVTMGESGPWIVLVLSLSSCAYDLTLAIALMGIRGDIRVIPEFRTENGVVLLRVA